MESAYLNFLWECSTEHESLPRAGRRHCILLHNTPDLRLKAHVQHTISFVQHQITVQQHMCLSNMLLTISDPILIK